MSGSRIFAGSGSGPTLTVPPPSGEPFALEPLFDAVDHVMTCVWLCCRVAGGDRAHGSRFLELGSCPCVVS